MLELRKIKPVFSQVLVTEELYGYDDRNEAGIITAVKGDVKPYQRVIAVSDEVKCVKPGDIVAINFYKYAELKEDPNSIKAMGGNSVVSLRLNEVELTDDKGESQMCFIIDQRDIKYVIEDSKEITYTQKDDKPVIILPNTNLTL